MAKQPKSKKLHLIEMRYHGDFAFTNAADANRFATLLAKSIPVRWDYNNENPYHHIQTKSEQQIAYTIKLNQTIELEKRQKIEVIPPEKKTPRLPAPRKGLPAPLRGLPAPNQD